jgi:hypothetical protein
MPVKFDGATSGDRYDYRPDVSKPFDSQKPQDTSGTCASKVQWCQNTGMRNLPNADPPVPNCGTPDDSAT